jgi:tol-pal system protein YbgF
MIPLRALVIAVVLAGALPSYAGIFSDDDARKSIYDLRADLLQLKTADETRFTRIESNIDTLQQASNRIQQSLDRIDQSLRNLNLPALQSQLESVNSDVARLNGAVEVQTNAVEQDQKRNKEFYLDLDSRLRALEKPILVKKEEAAIVSAAEVSSSVEAGSAATTTPDLPVKTPNAGVSTTSQASPPTMAEQKSYDQAQQAFKASNFVVAVKEFQAFSKAYPRSSLSANAQFWLGVSHYRLKAYTAAEKSLKEVVMQYPDSPKAPDALLNLASVQLDAGNAAAAHDSLEQLISRFPASEAAAKAKARLGRK